MFNILISSLMLLVSPILWTPPSPNGHLEITFSNIPKEYVGKNLMVGYWKNNKGEFPKQGTSDFTHKVKISTTAQSVSKKLGDGSYSISAFIDVNGNGKLDTNFFGIPKEPYCFSKNFKPSLAAPNFEDCSIPHAGSTSLNIKMLNL